MTRLSVCGLGVSCNEMNDTPMLLVVSCNEMNDTPMLLVVISLLGKSRDDDSGRISY